MTSWETSGLDHSPLQGQGANAALRMLEDSMETCQAFVMRASIFMLEGGRASFAMK